MVYSAPTEAEAQALRLDLAEATNLESRVLSLNKCRVCKGFDLRVSQPHRVSRSKRRRAVGASCREGDLRPLPSHLVP